MLIAKFVLFSVSGLKDKKLIKVQSYTKTEAYIVYSRVFWIFPPNAIKIDFYNFDLYRFKDSTFFETLCTRLLILMYYFQSDEVSLGLSRLMLLVGNRCGPGCLRAYASKAMPASSQQNWLLLTSLLILSDVPNVKKLPSSQIRYQVFWPLITVILKQVMCRNLSQITASYQTLERSSF